MTMTAAEIDGVVFAVGSAQLADAAQAPAAIDAMQTAMVNNIGASVTAARHGQRHARNRCKRQGMRLVGRFLAKDRRIYQVVVIGPAQIEAEPVDTFLTSFKLNENDRWLKPA
jgi:RNase P protein component